ncbi:MAG: hypothetical protein J6Y78_05220 [Paludibacteraceae bacterium]|nr:hypothetical protein [Paludibacteraceae bacterium]
MAKENKVNNTDEAFKSLNENKVEKSLRNTKEFADAIKRAQGGEYDVDIEDACGADFIKITEKWSIRKMFSISEGKEYYKLYKEVFYLEDPHKYYFDTVTPTIYRRISGQKEQGDADWAKAVSEYLKIDIVE